MKVNATIRFTDTGTSSMDHADLKLPISVNFERDDINKLVDTSWLKMMIRRTIPGTGTKRIRLIYNGRVLNDQTNFKTEVFDPKLRQMQQAGDDSNTLEIYIHCLIGDEMTASQLEQERELDQRANDSQTDPPVIGFDRLLSQGVSAQEVDDLRRQFQQIHFPGANTGDLQGVTDMEENDRQQQQIRELEESWLDSTGYSAPSTGIQGGQAPPGVAAPGAGAMGDAEVSFSKESVIVGVLIGTFLGFLAVVFLMVDDTIFNRSHKMGIFGGILSNIIIASMKIWTPYGT